MSNQVSKPLAYVATTMIDGEMIFLAMDTCLGVNMSGRLAYAIMMNSPDQAARLIEKANDRFRVSLSKQEWTVRAIGLIDEPTG